MGASGGDNKTGLLVIDMISDFRFEDAVELFPFALQAAECIRGLKREAKAAEVPVIYVNDNFGKWHHDFKTITEFARETEKGRALADLIEPEDDDYFVLKPMHSAFYSTALEVLLEHLEIKKLILTGVTSDICVLFSANDAYMRGYELIIPEDCVAAVRKEQNEYALEYMERVLKADTRGATKLQLSSLAKAR